MYRSARYTLCVLREHLRVSGAGSDAALGWCTPFVRCGTRFDLLRFVWPLTAPLRHYLLRPPLTNAKRFFIHRVIPALFPKPPACLLVLLPGGGKVKVAYSEEIALLLLLHGAYEAAELQSLADFATPGSTVV